MGSRKPIAKITVLAGPGHPFSPSVDGKDWFGPGVHRIYNVDDLERVKAAIPARQMRVREYPRILDVPGDSAKPRKEKGTDDKPRAEDGEMTDSPKTKKKGAKKK